MEVSLKEERGVYSQQLRTGPPVGCAIVKTQKQWTGEGSWSLSTDSDYGNCEEMEGFAFSLILRAVCCRWKLCGYLSQNNLGFKFWLCYLPVLWSWASYVTSHSQGLGLLKDKLRPEPRLPMAHGRCAMRSTCFFHSELSLILLVYLAGGLTL